MKTIIMVFLVVALVVPTVATAAIERTSQAISATPQPSGNTPQALQQKESQVQSQVALKNDRENAPQNTKSVIPVIKSVSEAKTAIRATANDIAGVMAILNKLDIKNITQEDIESLYPKVKPDQGMIVQNFVVARFGNEVAIAVNGYIDTYHNNVPVGMSPFGEILLKNLQGTQKSTISVGSNVVRMTFSKKGELIVLPWYGSPQLYSQKGQLIAYVRKIKWNKNGRE